MEFQHLCGLVGESAWNWKQGRDLKRKINLLSDEVHLKKKDARKLNEAARQARGRKSEAYKVQDLQEMAKQEGIQRKNEETMEEVEDAIRVLTRRRLDLGYEMGKHELKFNELEKEMRQRSDLSRVNHTRGVKRRRSEPGTREEKDMMAGESKRQVIPEGSAGARGNCCWCPTCKCACHATNQVQEKKVLQKTEKVGIVQGGWSGGGEKKIGVCKRRCLLGVWVFG